MERQSIVLGEYYPTDSFLTRMNPRKKILFLIVFSIIIFLINSLYLIIFLTFISFSLIYLTKISLKDVLKALKSISIFFIIVFLIQIIPDPEMVGEAFTVVLRFFNLFLASTVIMLTTSPTEMIKGIEVFLRPFDRLGLSSHKIAMMMVISVRFLPIFFEELEKIKDAQISRGMNYSKFSLRAIFSISIPLLNNLFKRAEELSLALETRCYV
ncbi:MAG: energy-coupling factor transporter transmembrane component T family protein [Candidatus Hydrothermarchaeota archaeon]